jgi:hypothetical protein
MSKHFNRVGLRYGKLTAVEKIRDRGETEWLCVCDCGNATMARGERLTSGRTWHCGCSVSRAHKGNALYGKRTARTVSGRSQSRRDIVRKVKSGGCSVCGYDKCVEALDMHHLRDKEFNISAMASGLGSHEQFMKEIDKCIVLCSNCHRELHSK